MSWDLSKEGLILALTLARTSLKVSGDILMVKQSNHRNSKILIIALAIVGLFIFFPVWINIYTALIYLIIHSLLVFGLLKTPAFQSTLKPLYFGLIISGIPLGLLLIQNLFTIPLYILSDSNLGEIIVVTGLTFLVCLVDFVSTYSI